MHKTIENNFQVKCN